jgi:hypothetical protein
MTSKYNQSFWDNFIQLVPYLRDVNVINPSKGKDYVDPVSAKNLFFIWRTAENKGSSNNVFKRPETLAYSDLEQMKKEGLIKVLGDRIEVTEKGSKVIRIMILGDERSSFDNNDTIIDYNQALNNSKGMKTAKQTKVASKIDWWERFE